MDLLLIVGMNVLGGAVQTVTGFGAGIVIMLFLPLLFNLLQASAISSAITLGLNLSLSLRFYRHLSPKRLALPCVLFLTASVSSILVASALNLEFLALAFGVFLVALSLYFLLAKDRLAIRDTPACAVFCSLLSGLTSGLFGVGGPLMAVYFLSGSKDKEEYAATLQTFFALTNLLNLFTRIAKGIYTPALLPATLVGLAGVLLGQRLGLRLLDRLSPDRMSRLVYLALGGAGLLTMFSHL